MTHHKAKAPTALTSGDALGNVQHHANLRDIALNLADVQTNFVARRTRLRPEMAQIVAALMFGRAA